jgi:hypothetical protein
MSARTTKQRQEANSLISTHYARAALKGIEIPVWNARLWRYVDLPRLVGMLASNALPLIRIDKFEDKWEGFSIPLSQQQYRGFFAEEKLKSDSERLEQGEYLRTSYYANCWHQSDIESDAMWKLYMKSDEGLAIRTTYQSLIYSLRKCQQDYYVGIVRYTKPSAGQSMLLTCMSKREPFQHEKEVRVIWYDTDAERGSRDKYSHSLCDANERPPVKHLRCDFKHLIEEIFISPKAGAWFAPAVKNLLEKYKLKEVKVSQSSLSMEPPG